MRILFLLLISAQSFSQIVGIVATTASNRSSSVFETITEDSLILFANPTNQKIWRSGVEYTGIISAPSSHQWAITDHCTQDTLATGTSNNVTHTFTFSSMNDCNVYDLCVTADGLVRVFPFEFTCLPQKPVSYNETWSASGQHDMGWTNRPGYKIRITGEFTGFINAWWLRSDDPTQPIHIVLDNITVNSGNAQNFRATAFKNVIIDGCTDDDVAYGMTLNKTGSAAQQLFVLEAAEANDASKRTSNVIICGIDANGNDIVGSGITAFRFINGRDATNNESTYQIDNIKHFNCRGRNTYEEAYYYGQSNDALSGGLGYPYFTDCLYYRLIGENAGNEVMQFGLNRNFEMALCTFKNGGTRNQNFHENLVQWSNGNQNGAFYMNYLEQGTHNLLAGGIGRTGGNNEFFSNVMYSAGKDADGAGNLWFQCDQSDLFADVNWSIFHNTIHYAQGTAFTLYEAYTTNWNKFNAVENLIVGENTTDYENASAVDPTHVVFSNYKVLTANISTVGFVDYLNKDYHLNSLSSPAFGASTSITKTHWMSDYDFDGYKYSTPIRGAFSGVELMTLD